MLEGTRQFSFIQGDGGGDGGGGVRGVRTLNFACTWSDTLTKLENCLIVEYPLN